jgi:peptidoglycan biosynthesis protein MviN/MurJ (putative lipid II flippase)
MILCEKPVFHVYGTLLCRVFSLHRERIPALPLQFLLYDAFDMGYKIPNILADER